MVRALPAFLVLTAVLSGLPLAGGCTRTSDGTLVARKPPEVRTLLPSWMPGHREETPPAPRVFPQAPGRAASLSDDTGRPLVENRGAMRCREVDSAGRVRVVCR